MKSFRNVANVVSLLAILFLQQGNAISPVEQGSDFFSAGKRPSLQEVELYLHSIGYTLQDTCQGHSLSFSPDSTARMLEEETNAEDKDQFFYIKNGLLAFACVAIAALAAGLTMGLVSQELLDLKIKEIAGSAQEKAQARSVLPLIKDHHRLLVTLLLMNAMANEALPLFLDKIVPGYVAVIMSVTLVLFFGEIIPSAIFSGPNKLAISSKLAPIVQFLLWILCPLAFPIAKVLDKVLHEEGEDGVMQKYDRAELSALVRLQYEERNAHMLKSRHAGILAGLDPSLISNRPDNGSVRFVKHIDTVNMVEGALEMQSKTAADVMVPLEDVFIISKDLVLDESNILDIYRSGYSRIPVHEPGNKAHISGVFRTRQIMVLNPDEERELATLPLIQPHCIQPQMNMLNLVNLLQVGATVNKGGHLAIVCQDPSVANMALEKGDNIPDSAGVVGIVTLENCIEVLIKEAIYDENDKAEKVSMERARWAADKWISYVKRRREGSQSIAAIANQKDEVDETSALIQSTHDAVYEYQFQFQEYLV